LLKETMSAFDGARKARTHNFHIASQTRNPLRNTAPCLKIQVLFIIPNLLIDFL